MGCCLCGVSSLLFVDGGARMMIKLSGKKRSIQYDLWKIIFLVCNRENRDFESHFHLHFGAKIGQYLRMADLDIRILQQEPFVREKFLVFELLETV